MKCLNKYLPLDVVVYGRLVSINFRNNMNMTRTNNKRAASANLWFSYFRTNSSYYCWSEIYTETCFEGSFVHRNIYFPYISMLQIYAIKTSQKETCASNLVCPFLHYNLQVYITRLTYVFWVANTTNSFL